jgi:hypothetical protein
MRGEIMKNFIIFLLTIFILSCATAPPQISDDGFISSRPNLQVQFHKPIVKKSLESRRIAGGDIKAYQFWVNDTECILIEILTVFHSTRIDYIYGPEQVLINWGRMVLDPVVIDGRQWIKFIDVFNNEAVFTGYFRIMGQTFISVGRFCSASPYTEEIGSFQKGKLKSGQWKLWDEAFAHTDQLFSIGIVAPEESESTAPVHTPVAETKVIGRDGTFIAYANGVVKDTKTGLEWIAGPDRNTSWNDAVSWVVNLNVVGGGWRMPTINELEILYQQGVGTRNITPLLKTTGWWLWSGQTTGSTRAYAFSIGTDAKRQSNLDRKFNYRCFAVRSQKK